MIDTTHYYKDWDGQVTLGNQIEFYLTDNYNNEIIFTFRIYNHGLAIDWIQKFYKLMQNKVLQNDKISYDSIENSLQFFQENFQEKLYVLQKNFKCFSNRDEMGCYLLLKTENSVLNQNLNYVKVIPSFVFDRQTDIGISNKANQNHFNDTINWNKQNQNRTLLQPLTLPEQDILEKGICRVGFLSKLRVNGNNLNTFSIDTTDLKFVKIEFTIVD